MTSTDLARIVFEMGFTEDWLHLGMLSNALLAELAADYQSQPDARPEHYRHQAFTRFMHQHEVLSPEHFTALAQLADLDENPELGNTMWSDLIERKDCPLAVLVQATQKKSRALQKRALKRLQDQA